MITPSAFFLLHVVVTVWRGRLGGRRARIEKARRLCG